MLSIRIRAVVISPTAVDGCVEPDICSSHRVGIADCDVASASAFPYARQGRERLTPRFSTHDARFASSTSWKSYMPTQMKSAPFSKA